MEIKTSMTTCPNGHHYDAAKNSSCPFCGGAGGFAPTEPLGAGSPPSSFTPTAPPSGMFSATEPPASSVGRNPNFSATVPPAGASGGSNPNAFSSPTIIGGSSKAVGDSNEPVVGWLVSVEGPTRGVDYRIHTGYNYIGREAGDIRIQGDQQISRQNHAMLAYVKKERKFYVGPVAGLNIIEVNGKSVLQSAVEIHNYDLISIGATKLIFVGLCGEEFDWGKKASDND